MSNIVLREKTEISENLIKNSERKFIVLSNEIVQKGLSEIECSVANASIIGDGLLNSRKPIKSLDDGELKEEIKQTLKFIVRDLGLKNWGGDDAVYDAMRFMELLKKYYSELSYKEVELAFELLNVGKLDEYLPKGSGNKVEKNHYQSFSVEYVCRVLNAFKEYRNKVWSKAYKLLPSETNQISEEEKQKTNDYFVNDLLDKFDEYKKDGVKPMFSSVSIYYNKLLERGFLDEELEISKEDRSAYYVEIMANGFKNDFYKRSISKDHNKGVKNTAIDFGSERKCMERKIVEFFKEAIELEIDLREEFGHKA